MPVLRIAFAAVLLLAGTAASAQTETDAQCLILSNIFAKQAKEAPQQKAAEAAVYFYMGRVRTGITAAQMKALLETASKPITDANAGPKMNDCLKTLQATGQLLQSIAPPPETAPATAPKPAQPNQPKPQGR